jgi:hypothetical protein
VAWSAVEDEGCVRVGHVLWGGRGKCNIMYHECEMENEQYGDEPKLQNMPYLFI